MSVEGKIEKAAGFRRLFMRFDRFGFCAGQSRSGPPLPP
jgi:hypothetical protein